MLTNALFRDCRDYRVPLRECPSFLFLMLGMSTIVAMIATHLLALRYTDEPELSVFVVIGVAVLFLLVGHSIVSSFRRLAEANVVKSEFVSIASHQLRTPLTSIKWAGAMLAGGQTHNAEFCLDIIQDNTERMIMLVNDLLDANRIESGTLAVQKEKIQLEAVVKKVIDALARMAQASNIRLEFQNPSATFSPILADARRIEMVVQNLIDNAIRYTPGKGTVTVRMEEKDRRIFCFIQDTGVGVPATDQKRIFQKFFRSANALKYQTGGTGLGLFIARAIVELFDGDIGFQSQEGKGSTFWFSLPVTTAYV